MSNKEKEYDHEISLENDDDEVTIDLDKDWKPPKEEDLKVEVEAEKDEAKDEPPPKEPDPEPAPQPRRVDPEVLELREAIANMSRRFQERDETDWKATQEREDRDLNTKLTDARAKLKKAQEAGNSDEASEAMEELTNLAVERKAREITRAQAEQARKEQAQRPQQQPQQNPLTAQWLQKNPWYGKREHAVETLAARVIDSEMVNEGFTPNTEDYFEEMNNRLRSRFRTIDPVGFKAKAPEKKKEEPPKTQPPRQTGRTVKPGTVVLKKGHFGLMRMVGLDPDSSEDRRTYAKSIRDNGDPLEN